METASTIRVAPALAALAVVRDFGLDPVAILTEAGWSPALLDDPDNIVPFAALGRLIEVAAARTACPHFGLLLGQKAGPSVIGTLGFASRNAPDVRSALFLLSQRLAHHDRGGVATFAEDGTVAPARLSHLRSKGASQRTHNHCFVGDWLPTFESPVRAVLATAGDEFRNFADLQMLSPTTSCSVTPCTSTRGNPPFHSQRTGSIVRSLAPILNCSECCFERLVTRRRFRRNATCGMRSAACWQE